MVSIGVPRPNSSRVAACRRLAWSAAMMSQQRCSLSKCLQCATCSQPGVMLLVRLGSLTGAFLILRRDPNSLTTDQHRFDMLGRQRFESQHRREPAAELFQG